MKNLAGMFVMTSALVGIFCWLSADTYGWGFTLFLGLMAFLMLLFLSVARLIGNGLRYILAKWDEHDAKKEAEYKNRN